MRRPGVRVQDSLYGIIDLNDAQRRIIDSRPFQRLLSVKQLGFAYAVFPGADYSRFSHSIGASHVAARSIKALEDYGGQKFEDADRTIYRLAALLHDIGHYPFSHATEDAVRRRYETNLTVGDNATRWLKHEAVGSAILEIDQEVKKAFDYAGISPDVVRRVFTKSDPERLTALVSSDIDVDRLDYLPRTAYHTGIPFGKVDQEYILREMRIDNQDRLCWSPRALASLDHVLLARFYDYQQIVQNKTVVGLEELLKDIVYTLTDPNLGNDALDLSEAGIRRMITSGDWFGFDDHNLFERIKQSKHLITSDSCHKQKCEALLERKPPRRVAEVSELRRSDFDSSFDQLVKSAESLKLECANKFDIDRELWWLWARRRSLTAYNGYDTPLEIDEATDEMVRLINKDQTSSIAVNNPQSLVGKLYTIKTYSVRLYVLLEKSDARRVEIEKYAQSALEKIWSDCASGTMTLFTSGK